MDGITVEVKGVGRLRFRKQTFRDQYAISGLQYRLMDGAEGPDSLALACYVHARLVVLRDEDDCDWNPDELDVFDPASFTQIREVYQALEAAEARFRKPSKVEPAPEGEGTE